MSDKDTRNPYVILGVSPGAGSREANAAFARASIKAKNGMSPWTQQDLNWALHQIENEEAAALSSHFRIPANPEVLRPSLSALLESAKRRIESND